MSFAIVVDIFQSSLIIFLSSKINESSTEFRITVLDSNVLGTETLMCKSQKHLVCWSSKESYAVCRTLLSSPSVTHNKWPRMLAVEKSLPRWACKMLRSYRQTHGVPIDTSDYSCSQTPIHAGSPPLYLNFSKILPWNAVIVDKTSDSRSLQTSL